MPAWFEETEGGRLLLEASDLRPAPPGSGDSPLGTKAGMIGWKTVERRDGRYFGVGIDGRRWDKPLLQHDGTVALPVALLRQVGTNEFLPVTTAGPQAGQRSLFQAGPNLYVPVTGGPRAGSYSIWDPSGSTTIASLQDSGSDHASGQATALPLSFWHFLRPRDQASSQKLRKISERECAALLKAAEEDRKLEHDIPRGRTKETALGPLEKTLPAVKKLLPTAPERMALGIARFSNGRDEPAPRSSRFATRRSLIRRRNRRPRRRLSISHVIAPRLSGEWSRFRCTEPTKRSRRVRIWQPPRSFSKESPTGAIFRRLATSGSRCWKICLCGAGKRTGGPLQKK